MTAKLILASLLCMACCQAQGQSADSLPSFEVASVKRLPARSAPRFEAAPTRFIAHSIPLGPLIRWAYSLRLNQRYQLAGPDWMEAGGQEIRYDVDAEIANPVTTAQMRLMVRALLAERWKLTMHRETRMLPAWVLSVADAAKLRKSESQGEVQHKYHGTAIDFVGGSMADLAEALELNVFALIIEETGLEGRYDFTLDCMKYADLAVPQDIPGSPQAADFGPACNLALRDFGLRLERQRRPVEVLVIDHAEKTPTEN